MSIRSAKTVSLAASFLMLVACGDGAGDSPDSAVNATASPDISGPAQPDGDAPSGPEGTTAAPTVEYRTFIGDWKMSPGRETTRCVVKRLENTEEIWVNAIRTDLDPGSHHVIVYRSNASEEILEPQPCNPFADVLDGATYPLMITQVANERLAFPPGVALKMEPHQMIRIEAHYLNYFDQPITAHADVTFETIPADEVVNEAGLMLYGTPDIRLPANQTTSTPWYFLPIWEGVKVFRATGHTHRFGTAVELYKAPPSDPFGVSQLPDDGAQPIYPLDQEFTWDEAPVITYDPPLEFGPDEGIRYRCTWENTSGRTVRFGESANQEMCFFWLYYYPTNGYRLCVNLGSWYDYAPGLLNPVECCPDSAICPLLRDYLNGEIDI